MAFKIKNTQNKNETVYKSLYMKKSLSDKISELAKTHNTSWNNIVISMIESCLEEDEDDA